MNKQLLTVLIVFYNGEREAKRSLYSLTRTYQNLSPENEYDVIVLDSGSTKPLSAKMVQSFGDNFKYHYVKTNHRSPVEALQFGLSIVETPYTSIIIDGAHILSPGIMNQFYKIQSFAPDCFIYTSKYHLGPYHQNDSLTVGYNQEKEDKMLAAVDWKKNGYLLFDNCNFHHSPFSEFEISFESNCYFAKTSALRATKVFDQPFHSMGGGLVNLDVFKRLITNENIDNYCIIGEGTFHQYHGGASTNIERKLHPVGTYMQEYFDIYDKPYIASETIPTFYGKYNEVTRKYSPRRNFLHFVTFLTPKLSNSNPEGYVTFAKMAIEAYPFQREFYSRLGKHYERHKNFEEAEKYLLLAREISRNTKPPLHDLIRFYSIEKKDFEKAAFYADEAVQIAPMDAVLLATKVKTNFLQKETSSSPALLTRIDAILDSYDLIPYHIINSTFRLLFDGREFGWCNKAFEKYKPQFYNKEEYLLFGMDLAKQNYAKAAFEKLVHDYEHQSHYTKSKRLFRIVALAALNLGYFDIAYNYYKAYFEVLPLTQDRRNLQNYAIACILSDRLDEAKMLFEKCNKLIDPKSIISNPIIKIYLDWLEHKDGTQVLESLKNHGKVFNRPVQLSVLFKIINHYPADQQTKLLDEILTIFIDKKMIFSKNSFLEFFALCSSNAENRINLEALKSLATQRFANISIDTKNEIFNNQPTESDQQLLAKIEVLLDFQKNQHTLTNNR